jgi:hypothetical protein
MSLCCREVWLSSVCRYAVSLSVADARSFQYITVWVGRVLQRVSIWSIMRAGELYAAMVIVAPLEGTDAQGMQPVAHQKPAGERPAVCFVCYSADTEPAMKAKLTEALALAGLAGKRLEWQRGAGCGRSGHRAGRSGGKVSLGGVVTCEVSDVGIDSRVSYVAAGGLPLKRLARDKRNALYETWRRYGHRLPGRNPDRHVSS